MVTVGASGKPQSSRMRRCSHSEVASAVSMASAWMACALKNAPAFFHSSLFSRMPNLAGLTPWVLMDFRSPTRLLPSVQDYHNRKGLISNRGRRKLAFYTLQKFYKRLADAGK